MHQRFIDWLDAIPRRTKVVLIVVAFLTLPFLLLSSRLITVLTVGFFLLSVVMLVVRSYRGEPSRNWAIAVGAYLLVLFGFLTLAIGLYSALSEEWAAKETETRMASDKADAKPDAASDKTGSGSDYGKADYDGPGTSSKQPIEVVLRVTGSEGGVYKGWHYREETSDTSDSLDSLIAHTDKPDFRGVIGPRPKEYRFTLGDGVYKDPTGDVEWDELSIDIQKAQRRGRDWEGEIYAELIVDGKVVSCSGTEPFDGLTVSWSPENKGGGFFEKLNCDN